MIQGIQTMAWALALRRPEITEELYNIEGLPSLVVSEQRVQRPG